MGLIFESLLLLEDAIGNPISIKKQGANRDKYVQPLGA